MKLLLFVSLVSIATFAEALKEGDCEGKSNSTQDKTWQHGNSSISFLIFAVCVSVLEKFRNNHLPKEDASTPDKINEHFKKFCKDLKLKENRFVSLAI